MSAFASQNRTRSPRTIGRRISLSHLQKPTNYLKFHQSGTPPQARQKYGRTHDHREDGEMIRALQKTFSNEIGKQKHQ